MKDKYRFLVLDDDQDDLHLIVEDLKSSGYEVEGYVHFEEFWNKLKTSNPNVVIIDMVNPEMPGWQVCERVRRTTGHKGVKILATSGILGQEDIERMDLKADGCITKPVNIDQLENVLADLFKEQ